MRGYMYARVYMNTHTHTHTHTHIIQHTRTHIITMQHAPFSIEEHKFLFSSYLNVDMAERGCHKLVPYGVAMIHIERKQRHCCERLNGENDSIEYNKKVDGCRFGIRASG